MNQRVQCFVYSGEKSGKGIIDFYTVDDLKSFLKNGGTLLMRTQEGDISLSVEPIKDKNGLKNS